ncbi:MAG: 30S ribosome-binding factor RbfA [Candidatus Omnitrophica bacterium]|nr:30S ribosome-binding factor RbfA [Candidatus Omnitrophota bacterium]MCF7877505.1 30S ribosome-binding factor RbfA [Candidatus Omnitrophota bacterium]MCF7877866.1 30S ribosome-binding factor RbfA [Candidatus Omnitrophota bacterium]MCF7892558.1 30S ribosome-binding factor RbfA [Candidatus Omnitrophota bacterium]
MSIRLEKINAEIRRQLMKIIQQEIDDPNIGLITLTKVDTSSDLEEAKVYFSLLDQNKQQKVKKILDEMKGFIKTLLAKKVRLKKTPDLVFRLDKSIKYSLDIYQKIEELKDEEDKDK